MPSRVERINSAVDSGLGVIRHTVTATMDAFEECFSSIAIPCADAAVALLAAQNMVTALGFSLVVSVITGLSLEGVGLVANRAALRCYYYNQTRAPGAPKALAGLAWVLLGLQFGIGCVLVAVNTVAVNARMWGVLTIALLGSIGTAAHLLESMVKAHEKSPSPQAPVAQDLAQPVIIEQPASTRERVLRYVEDHPEDTQDKVAEALGVSRQTVSNYKRSNGNGRH